MYIDHCHSLLSRSFPMTIAKFFVLFLSSSPSHIFCYICLLFTPISFSISLPPSPFLSSLYITVFLSSSYIYGQSDISTKKIKVFVKNLLSWCVINNSNTGGKWSNPMCMSLIAINSTYGYPFLSSLASPWFLKSDANRCCGCFFRKPSHFSYISYYPLAFTCARLYFSPKVWKGITSPPMYGKALLLPFSKSTPVSVTGVGRQVQRHAFSCSETAETREHVTRSVPEGSCRHEEHETRKVSVFNMYLKLI